MEAADHIRGDESTILSIIKMDAGVLNSIEDRCGDFQ
jgi:hypothetical protein